MDRIILYLFYYTTYLDVTDMPLLEDKTGKVEKADYKKLEISFSSWEIDKTWIYNTIPTMLNSFT